MKKGLFLLLLTVSSLLYGQYKAPYFNLLGLENGLPNTTVFWTLEDRLGFFWIGTVNGVARYDGYQVKQYPLYNEDGLPIKAANINQLFEDSHGDLWVAISLNGLNRLDRKTDQFQYVSNGKSIDSLLKKISINHFFEDKKTKDAWVLGYDAIRDRQNIYHLDFAGGQFQVYNEMGKGPRFLPIGKTIWMTRDHWQRIWTLTDSTLYLLDTASGVFKPRFQIPVSSAMERFTAFQVDPVEPDIIWMNTIRVTDPKNSPQNDIRGMLRVNIKSKEYQFSFPGSTAAHTIPKNAYHVFTDSLNRIWVSVEGGIYLYDRKTGTYTGYDLPSSDKLSHGEGVVNDKEGNAWVRGNRSGLYYIDINTGSVYPYVVTGSMGSLPANRVFRNFYFDRSGTFWVTVENEGLAWQDRKKTQFAPSSLPIKTGPGTPDRSETQYAIVGVEGDSICYLKDSSRLIAWNTVRNSFTDIDLGDKKNHRYILNVVKSKDGQLWMAAGDNGILNYNPVSRQVTNYSKVAGDTITLTGSYTIDLAIDQKGIIWIANDLNGLLSFDPVRKKFKRYPYIINDGSRMVNDSLDDRTATCLLVDQSGIIWVGTNNGGVNSYDPVNNKFRSYLNQKEAFFAITAMYEDSRKRIWAATFLSGLFLLDRKTGNFEIFNEKNGLLFNTVFYILEDREGQIWAFTSKGISRIDPEKKVITNFPSAKPWIYEFTVRALYDRNGIFNFAGRNGIIRFNPLKLDKSSTPPQVYIESVGYRGSGMSNDSLIFTDGRERIRLKYHENRISFQFTALHFANPQENQYAYQLENYDKDWILAGTQRSVTYSNLPPGKYVFKVKAANSDGLWNETGARFTIIISPPWWKTWWAYCLYALLAVGLIWTYIRVRSKTLRRENLVLEQKVEHRTKQLQESIESLRSTQAQLIQSEKMASLGELTAGIAHEIQNPLNFVNNFSELNKELLTELNDEIRTGNLEEAKKITASVMDNEDKILYHGKRADAIVKGMLQHSRSGSGQKELTDINALCDEYLRLSYHGLRAKDKSFNAAMETDFDPGVGKIPVLPQELGRVILNLINNAFYAVTERKRKSEPGYEPKVTVSSKRRQGAGKDSKPEILIMIRDNGTGIPPAVREKIFQPFFTTKPTGQGTGLGLSMSYDIISKGHGGELLVESREGEYTLFTILLPL